jgi:hypothetical protein
MSVWAVFICSCLGPETGSCEHGTEPSNSITGGEFLDQVSEYYFLNKNSAPWSYLFYLRLI